MAIPSTMNAIGVAITEISKVSSISGESVVELSKAFSVLKPQKIIDLALSGDLSQAALVEAVSRADLTDEIKKEIIEKYASAVATKAQDAANKGATLSTLTFKNAMKGLGAVMKANWVGLALTAIAVILPAVISLVNHFTTTLKEQQEIVSGLANEISSLQSEYEALGEKSKTEDLTEAEQRKLELLKAQLAVKEKQLAIDSKKQEKQQFGDDDVTTGNYGETTIVSGGRSQAYADLDKYKSAKESLEKYNAEIEKYSDVTGMSDKEVAKANKELDKAQKGRAEAEQQMNDSSLAILENITTLENLKESTGALEPENQKLLDDLYEQANAFGLFAQGTGDAKDGLDGLSAGVTSLSKSLTSLSAAKDQLSVLGTAYKNLAEDGSVGFSTLIEITEKFKDAVPNIDDYANSLLNAKGNTEETNRVLSELAYASIEAKLGVNGLANATREQVAAMLEEVGVANSLEVATYLVANAKAAVAVQTANTSGTIGNFITNLDAEAQQAGITKQALADLVAQEIVFNNSTLDVSQKISALYSLASAAADAANMISLATAQHAVQSSIGNYVMNQGMSQEAAEQKALKEYYGSLPKFSSSSPKVEWRGSGGGSGGGGGGGGGSEEYVATID